ncbi:MAG: hypothetical protein AB1767_07965 [Bacillota bacterium]
MSIKLLLLENSAELEKIEDNEEWKQDCELKAFYRLAKRLKKEFPVHQEISRKDSSRLLV